MDLTFRHLREEDIKELTLIMKEAFDYDTHIHLNKKEGGPKGYDNGDFLRKWALDKKSTSYCIYVDDVLIGGVILWINEDDVNYLGNLFIKVEYENKGIGTKVWKEIEGLYPYTRVWKTETPIFSKRNLNFYVNKCGFYVVRVKDILRDEEAMYVFEKVMI